MDIFLPKDKVKPGQILTEEDYQVAADKAFRYALIGLLIPILEIEVFRHVDRARKSKNPEILSKAQQAVNIATVVFFYVIIFPLVVVSSLWNLFAGIVVALSLALFIYFKRKDIWSQRKIIIAIIAIVLFLIYGIFISLDNAKQEIGVNSSDNTTEVVAIDFKNISSDEIINEINKLPASTQVAAYKKHSALVEEAGQVWQQNLQGKDFKVAVDKSLPILMSRGWTENSARDILLWMLAKSSIIVLRPGGGCQGADCPKSDQEIANNLKESFNLSIKVINGVFQELEIDHGGTLNFKPLLDFSAFENR